MKNEATNVLTSERRRENNKMNVVWFVLRRFGAFFQLSRTGWQAESERRESRAVRNMLIE